MKNKMIGTSFQSNEIESFRMANSLIKDSTRISSSGASFEEVLENQAQEALRNVKEKAQDVIVQDKNFGKRKKIKDDLRKNEILELPNFRQNIEGRKLFGDLQNAHGLFDKGKERKKFQDEDLFSSKKQQLLNNSSSIAGQPLFQPVYDQPRRRMTKSQMLEQWEKLAPMVTEDITKKTVRLDIPLLNDVQALVLRLHSDRSITASLLGSQQMVDLIKQSKDRLDRNLRHHHLSLREFNTYRSELEFNFESGTKKKRKRQAKSIKKVDLDLI